MLGPLILISFVAASAIAFQLNHGNDTNEDIQPESLENYATKNPQLTYGEDTNNKVSIANFGGPGNDQFEERLKPKPGKGRQYAAKQARKARKLQQELLGDQHPKHPDHKTPKMKYHVIHELDSPEPQHERTQEKEVDDDEEYQWG